MDCIYCNGKTKVVNSRKHKKYLSVWRRRQCIDCKAIFTSEEKIDYSRSLVIVEGRKITPYNQDKLLISIYKACLHRNQPESDASGLARTVTTRLIKKSHNAQVEMNDIIQTTLLTLKAFDKAAYTSYKAFHKAK